MPAGSASLQRTWTVVVCSVMNAPSPLALRRTRDDETARSRPTAVVGSTHQKPARDLAAHGLDLILADALRHQAGHQHRVPVGLGRVARLPQIGAEDEVLGPDRLHVLGGFLVR